MVLAAAILDDKRGINPGRVDSTAMRPLTRRRRDEPAGRGVYRSAAGHRLVPSDA